jgi:hypothetical protein
MVKRGNIPMFNQLVDSLDFALDKFEESFEKKDANSFIEIKKLMMNLQEEILKISK